MTHTLLRPLLLVASLFLAACETQTTLQAPSEALAGFKLGHAVVLAEKAVQAPISRNATPEEWTTAMNTAVAERFGRLNGDQVYHLGIHIDGFAVAPPGIPLVVSPKSVLIFSVTLFANDSGGRKLNEKPKQITVFEGLSGETVLGSGLTRTKAEQMQNLAFNGAKAIEDWILENPHFLNPSLPVPVEEKPVQGGRG
ncbi:MAG: hypothetical protein Q7J57_00365 [Gemmobacter sp.]|nr:hypothetical protein [Gemmobacter sp.]